MTIPRPLSQHEVTITYRTLLPRFHRAPSTMRIPSCALRCTPPLCGFFWADSTVRIFHRADRADSIVQIPLYPIVMQIPLCKIHPIMWIPSCRFHREDSGADSIVRILSCAFNHLHFIVCIPLCARQVNLILLRACDEVRSSLLWVGCYCESVVVGLTFMG